MRAVVSYSDITDSQPPTIADTTDGGGQQPPAKRRRKSRGGKNQNQNAQQHWDDPGAAGPSNGYGDSYGPPEESRDLTHEEIWDDSALIDAWNAATEEYEVLNGPDKKWKKEPVHKSPLWYNSLPGSSTSGQTNKRRVPPDDEDSAPIDFDTFVPTHEPLPTADTHPPHFNFPPMPAAHAGSAEEALQNAYGAWYWAGYWSGVYQTLKDKNPVTEDEEAFDDAAEEEAVEQEDGEVS